MVASSHAPHLACRKSPPSKPVSRGHQGKPSAITKVFHSTCNEPLNRPSIAGPCSLPPSALRRSESRPEAYLSHLLSSMPHLAPALAPGAVLMPTFMDALFCQVGGGAGGAKQQWCATPLTGEGGEGQDRATEKALQVG